MGEQALLQDLLGAQGVAAMHQHHLAGMVGQIQRLFHGGIAAADHHHLLAAIEETVAGSAGRHAEALEFLLARQAEPARLRSEEHTSELQSLMRISYAVFCLKKNT